MRQSVFADPALVVVDFHIDDWRRYGNRRPPQSHGAPAVEFPTLSRRHSTRLMVCDELRGLAPLASENRKGRWDHCDGLT